MAQEKWNGVPVRYDWLPIGTRRSGQPLTTGKPKFAVAHDTGNKDTTAQDNINYYKNSYNIDWSIVASAHIFVDDKECVVCIPVTEKAWHVLYGASTDNQMYGVDANDGAFGAEGCYFTDKTRSQKSLDNLARVTAYLCNYWNIDYKTELPGHQDIQVGKVDPGNLLEHAGYGRDVSNLDKIIAKYINGVDEGSDSEPSKELSEPTKEKPTESPHTDISYKEAIEYMHSLKGRFVDFDKQFAFQCMDLIVDFANHVTNGYRIWGNAKDLTWVALPKGWKLVENTPDYVPPIASIAVFTEGVYKKWGHTGLVWDNSGGTESFVILEQNYDALANSPAKLRTDNFEGLTHFIIPDFVDEDVDLKDIKPTKVKESKKGKALKVGNVPPKKLTWSNQPYFRATADSEGVSICRPNHNNVMVVTNEQYNAGYEDLYIYEIRDGWARVYSPSNDGFVWYERLRMNEIYKPAGGNGLHDDVSAYGNVPTDLAIGSIPPSDLNWSDSAYFRGRIDSYGATITKRTGNSGNYDWNLTNESYRSGYDQFYIFEILEGWARVYSSSNNGWIWYERLRVAETF